MDHYGLPPADLPILSTPEMLVPPLMAAIKKLRCTEQPAAPAFPSTQCPGAGPAACDGDDGGSAISRWLFANLSPGGMSRWPTIR